ncbi:NAD-glutamate dehydrogenase [Nocardioides mangrovicus]|uniref:NAD-glutamate dehydrogenase n=1 Tax=Nocardioides mangrovicus TaxID=2478913 RepID=A0A3L8P494_9ACTN|nr:NAD-glutamate dehydrogenase [Nocardioides mangrovicus]RLV49872.1 NAD-glutamate dehydrogenase [Nocardioides mangrovicus]
MSASLDARKDALLNDLFAQAKNLPTLDGVDLEALIRGYYRHVPAEDIIDRTSRDLGAAVLHHLGTAGNRPQGTAVVRLLTPLRDRDGWSVGGRTVVEVVTDDMPFLVDSVSMALDAAGHEVRALFHPQFVVRRGVDGELQQVLADDAATGAHDVERESWMHVEIDRLPEGDGTEQAAVEAALLKVLQDVREAVEDWPRMHHQARVLVEELAEHPPSPASAITGEEVQQTRDFLLWLADNHFTFLGYREYDLEDREDGTFLRAVPGTGFGILRGDPDGGADAGRLADAVAGRAREKQLLVLAKANSRATVHRRVHLDYVGVKKFDAAGEVVGEKRFLGLFSSAAYTESVTRIPMLREKARRVIALAGYEPMSHAGKAVMDVLETYPRDELFQTPAEDLVRIADAVAQTRERRQLRLFLRRDSYGRYLSCLVYLPRDRYNTSVRERISTILKDRLGADSVDYTARVTESFAARLQFVARPPQGQELADVDTGALEQELAQAARSWTDDLAASVLERETDDGPQLVRRYSEAFPEAYKEDYDAATGAEDLCRIVSMGEDDLQLLLTPQHAGAGEARLKIFRTGPSLSLSQVLPMLTAMGVEIVDERPYVLTGLDQPTHIYDFGLHLGRPWPQAALEPFQHTVEAVWRGQAESDGFNALVLGAGLTWRQAMLLRAYARYLRQGNTPYSQEYIEETLAANVDITGYLVALFEARFDPGRNGLAADAESRVAKCEELVTRITRALDDVAGLDQDRILRSYLALIGATLRTNYFQPGADGEPHPYLSLKLEPSQIPDLPEPRPRFEIFVYSPRVEGVHLRFGAVARGGLRWSDRRDDFRTEVLGLVKAQMVKNTVIVPVGAKGGFVCKQLPDQKDRDAWLAEGIACYRTFISALLDVTDNLVGGAVVPPGLVVRHDADDSYLVVAADKGTATFSDIANEVAKSYGFWLGDAFASGGSVGYDHKAMGITARGAWVSVQRHFRERGIDCQAQDFTAVGIGDMSGDVFGNGMLCSEHIRLVAAFDHRDIFLDPNPDPSASYAERRRLFDLPRSSWQDYDADLVSEGGGIYSRAAKSIPVSAQVRAALGLAADVVALSPPELMRAILLSEVDLLWNGGIGTYVKASDETDAQAGDKANDAIRVDGRDLRCAIVGEGGNLGLTQLGRIEYAHAGGRLNTDFIDNSAGVDTSDHEVNIKILLDRVVADGDLSEDDRNELLASMTEEVGSLVLADNYEQNLALANSMHQAADLLHVQESWMRQLEADGRLNRALEGLPSRRENAGRIERREGLTDPELCVLLAYAKIGLAEELLTTDLADDPFLRNDLYSYFPHAMRQDYRSAMEAHPLRREIIVTQIVNDLVNGAGITYLHRLGGETGATPAELTRANFIAREVFGTEALRREINGFDNRVDAAVQTRMRLEVRTLAERASRWLVNNRRPPLDSEAIVDHFDVMTQRVLAALPDVMTGRELVAFEERRDEYVKQGVPAELAARVAAMPPAYMIIGIVETASRDGLDPLEVARVHFALGERLGLPTLVARILALPRTDRWETMARAALRDDLHGVHTQLTAQVLAATSPDDGAPARVTDWESEEEVVVSRAVATLEEICSDESADLARLSVGLRVVRSLLA